MTTLTYTRPRLYPKQEAAVFADERYAIIEASTKAGKTLACLIWLFEKTMACKAGQSTWWTAPIYSQAEIAFGRMRLGIPRDLYTINESKLYITLANGARMWFKGADKSDALYGEDVYAAVIDEASRVKEEAWHALRSTLTATRGPIRIIGNVKGRRNWFYIMARKAEAGDPDMHYARITARDAVEAGVIAQAEVEDAKRQLPEAVYRELYEAEPSDDEGNPFGVDAIRACIGPLSARPPVCFGVDLAKSHDYTVVIGLDAQGHVCRFDRWQAPWEVTIDRVTARVGTVPALVDSTGVGDPVLERLQKHGSNYRGFQFSAPSKQKIMEGLAVAIQQHEIMFPDGPITNELEAFEYVYSRSGVHYSAPDGLFDDCVCALALARSLMDHRPRPFEAAVGGTRPQLDAYNQQVASRYLQQRR